VNDFADVPDDGPGRSVESSDVSFENGGEVSVHRCVCTGVSDRNSSQPSPRSKHVAINRRTSVVLNPSAAVSVRQALPEMFTVSQ
jgi:hypothetical protein